MFEGWQVVLIGGVVDHPMSVLTVGVGCIVVHGLMPAVLSWGSK